MAGTARAGACGEGEKSMTLTMIDTTESVTGLAYRPRADFDSFLLAAGVTYGSSTFHFATASWDDLGFTFNGDAFAMRSLYLSGDRATVTIGAGGSFTCYEPIAASIAIQLVGEDSSFINEGLLYAPNCVGFFGSKSNGFGYNGGKIIAQTPVYLSVGVDGMRADFVNAGSITATVNGDRHDDLRFGNGVMSEACPSHVTNLETGRITTSGETGAGIRLGRFADASVVVNNGEILSQKSFAFHYGMIRDATETTTTNTGWASGGAGAYQGSGGADTLTNSGWLLGDVWMGAGDDLYDGRGGIVRGEITGGAGDDTFVLDGQSRGRLREAADEGNDQVIAWDSHRLGAHFETLLLEGTADLRGWGNGQANTLTGNVADNRLFGRGGDDLLSGDAGDDVLNGHWGDDHLFGGDDDDLLRGHKGADLLDGGDGEDILVGGAGVDVLIGGEDADVFRFTARSHSAPGQADRIRDFEPGIDHIDLSRLARDITLQPRGFSGDGGEVRLVEVRGDTRVLVDSNGDGRLDMRINVLGATGLTEDDLIL